MADDPIKILNFDSNFTVTEGAPGEYTISLTGPGGGGGGGTSAMRTASSITALRGLTGSTGEVVYLLGNTAADDGGGGFFAWKGTAGANDLDDGGTVLASAPGCWKRIISGDWNALWFGVRPGAGDMTLPLNNAIASLSRRGGGRLVVGSGLTSNATAAIYINSTIRVESNVVLDVQCALEYGPTGRLQIQGKLDDGTVRARLGANVSSGATQIVLENAVRSDPAQFAVGDRIILRGQNDSAGESLWKDEVTITAIDAGTRTITFTPALENSYQINYPTSDYQGGNDDTIIVKITKANITAGLTTGTTVITVSNAALFTVGDVVSIQDTKKGLNVSGTSNNYINVETNEIRAIDTVANTLTLTAPLVHDYDPAYNPVVQRTVPVRNAGVKNAVVRYTSASESTSYHTFAMKFAADCFFENCRVEGNLATGLGSVGHGFRMGEGTLRGRVENCKVANPATAASGEGYGATIYVGARFCTIKDSHFIRCRHSVLLFSGVANNLITGNLSEDCKGTDYDLHGANEVENTFLGNKAIGGPSTVGDITVKAAFKIGNPTHRVGAHRNVFQANEVYQHDGWAFHLIPVSQGNTIVNNIVHKAKLGGVFLQRNTSDLALQILNTVIDNNTFRDVDRMIQIDGGDSASKMVRNTTVTRNTAHNVATDAGAAVELRYTMDAMLKDNDVFALAGDTAVLRFQDSSNVELHGGYVRGGSVEAVRVSNVTGFLAHGQKFTPRTTRMILSVAGTSPAAQMLDYECLGFNPTFTLLSDTVCRSKIKKRARVADALARPTTMAGATYNRTFNDSPNDPTVGLLLCETTFKPSEPRGLVAFTANAPSVVTTASDNCLIAVFWDKGGTPVCAGMLTWRMTSGSATGTGATLAGTFQHDITDCDTDLHVQFRIVQRTNTTDLTLHSLFGGDDAFTLTVAET